RDFHVTGVQTCALPILIEQANAGANRAAELTQMLTAFSRRQPLRPQAVDVNTLLHKFETLLRRTLGEMIEIETIRSLELWSCEEIGRASCRERLESAGG